MTMVDYGASGQYALHPHRKPVPINPKVNHTDLQPLTKIVPDENRFVNDDQQQQQQQSLPPQRRSSIPYSAFPPRQASRQPIPATTAFQSSAPAPLYRRTPSQSTTSSVAHTGFTPTRTPSNVSSHISRTSSTRSDGSATSSSYVALMRKQKATVWCDRSQNEDPRIVAQRKAAKVRAAREVNSSLLTVEGRNSTSGSMGSASLGVRSKIRHHGLPKTAVYSANLVGGGVPMRLSANEVGDEGTYNREASDLRHERAWSRSSSGSQQNKYLSVGGAGPVPTQRRYSSGSAAHSGGSRGSPARDDGIPEVEETQDAADDAKRNEPSGAAGGSLSSSERESSFGRVGSMEAPAATSTRPIEGKTEEELRRRGSVDERANTMGYMGGGRLFVANPDLSD